ncbi:MAG: hypothetical protein OHK0021_04150 [Bryobacter sp.]
MLRIVFLLAGLGCSLPLAAQSPLSFGLKAGYVRSAEADPPFTGGAYLELAIPFLASFETGVLFKRYDFGPEAKGATEIPILLKKRIGPFPVKPFLSTGATLHKQSGRDWRTGFTIGGGVTISALLIKLEPELRFNRYGQGVLPGGRNQTEVLVGFRF